MSPEAETQTPVEPVTPPVEPAAAPDDSLAAHEAEFSPSPVAETEDEPEKPKLTRHRAEKDQASPRDVPRIRELTKANADLKAQLDALQKQRAESPKPEPTRAPIVAPAPTQQAVSGFTEKEPTLDDFGQDADPYASFVRALARYDRRKENYDADQAKALETAKADEAKQRADWDQAHLTFRDRAAEFVKTHPDYDALIQAQGTNGDLPPLAYQAVLRSDNGPAFVYHLLTHPDQLAEMHLLFDGKAVTEHSVALATRWLSSRVQTATTRSVVPTPPVVTVSRPPNLVRTGPMKTGDELPGDDGSLADHEKAFGSGRRR